MNDLLFRSTSHMVKLLTKLIDTKVSLEGSEYIDMHSPILFCSNHFTRLETFIMPTVFYQKLDLEVRSLADSSLFKGTLGEFISSLGSLSTADEARDDVMIGDLIQAKHNWIIYPEGRMMKNKKVLREKQGFRLQGPDETYDVHTGAAVLALKSELEKMRYVQADIDGDLYSINQIRERYGMDENSQIAYRSTKIIPVTITYTPVHPCKNPLSELAESFLEEQTPMLLEELEVEGSLLFFSKINIYLGEPINIAKEIQLAKKNLKLLNRSTDDESIIEHCRFDITNKMMDRIYSNVKIHLDHLFVLILKFWDNHEVLGVDEFKIRLFVLAHRLNESKILRLDDSLKEDFYQILSDEPFRVFDDALALAVKQKIIEYIDGKYLKIDKEALEKEHSFYDIRIKNTFLVMYNEVALLDILIDYSKELIGQSKDELRREAAFIVYDYDVRLFLSDYKKFYSLLYSKPKSVGTPYLLYNKAFTKGIVLSHGYKSAPKEVRDLAEHFFSKGFNVYAIRMRGHGTLPEDMRDRDWQSWYQSFNRGYAVIRCLSQNVYLGGFSTGGLLTLLAASKKEAPLEGLLCLSAALKLNDIRFNYVLPAVSMLNDFLALFNADIEAVESPPENPDINYSKHYLSSIGELKELMEETENILEKIKTPTLIIQADQDPTVDPKSAEIIFNKIQSKTKKRFTVHSKYHVIITRKEEQKELFKAIDTFFGL